MGAGEGPSGVLRSSGGQQGKRADGSLWGAQGLPWGLSWLTSWGLTMSQWRDTHGHPFTGWEAEGRECLREESKHIALNPAPGLQDRVYIRSLAWCSRERKP